MKVKILALALVCALAGVAMAVVTQAEAKKEVTLSGDLACAKCVLKMEGAKECSLVLTVKDGEKTTTYAVVAPKDAGTMGECCKAAQKASVTGTVEEKEGKKVLTASKIEIQKDEPRKG